MRRRTFYWFTNLEGAQPCSAHLHLAGFVVSGRDWAEGAVDCALGCTTSHSSKWILNFLQVTELQKSVWVCGSITLAISLLILLPSVKISFRATSILSLAESEHSFLILLAFLGPSLLGIVLLVRLGNSASPFSMS